MFLVYKTLLNIYIPIIHNYVHPQELEDVSQIKENIIREFFPESNAAKETSVILMKLYYS